VAAIRKVRNDGYSFETAKGIVFEIAAAMSPVKTKPISTVRIYCSFVEPLDTYEIFRADNTPAMTVSFERKFQKDNMTVRGGNKWSNIGKASLGRLTRALNSSNPNRVRVIVTNNVLNTYFIYEQEA